MPTTDKLTWQKSLRGADLTHAEYRVLTMLSTYANAESGNAHPGATRLAADCGMTRRGIQKILHALADKGWICLMAEGGNQHGIRGRADVYAIDLARANHRSPLADEQGRTQEHQGRTQKHPKGEPPFAPSNPEHQIQASNPLLPAEKFCGTKKDTTKKEQTVLTLEWQPKPRHHRMMSEHGLYEQDVLDMFLSMFRCDEPGCDTKPRSSSWDAKFSQFIKAYTEDRQEIDFNDHSWKHDPDFQDIVAEADRQHARRDRWATDPWATETGS